MNQIVRFLFHTGTLTPKKAYRKRCSLWVQLKVSRDDWFSDCQRILGKRFVICSEATLGESEISVAFFQCVLASAIIKEHQYLAADFGRGFMSELVKRVCVDDFGAEATNRAIDDAASAGSSSEETALALTRLAAKIITKSQNPSEEEAFLTQTAYALMWDTRRVVAEVFDDQKTISLADQKHSESRNFAYRKAKKE